MFISVILANFVLKFPNFPCRGNKRRSGVNFNDTAKMCKLENSTPWLVNTHGSISYITRVMANFVLILTHFCYHGNRSQLELGCKFQCCR